MLLSAFYFLEWKAGVTVDYKDVSQTVFYILLGFPPLTPPAYELTPFGSACIFTIKNIAALGHAVKC